VSPRTSISFRASTRRGRREGGREGGREGRAYLRLQQLHQVLDSGTDVTADLDLLQGKHKRFAGVLAALPLGKKVAELKEWREGGREGRRKK